MSKKKQRQQAWVDPEFKKELRFISAETGKCMEDITKDLAFELKNKRTKKEEKRFSFI